MTEFQGQTRSSSTTTLCQYKELVIDRRGKVWASNISGGEKRKKRGLSLPLRPQGIFSSTGGRDSGCFERCTSKGADCLWPGPHSTQASRGPREPDHPPPPKVKLVPREPNYPPPGHDLTEPPFPAPDKRPEEFVLPRD